MPVENDVEDTLSAMGAEVTLTDDIFLRITCNGHTVEIYADTQFDSPFPILPNYEESELGGTGLGFTFAVDYITLTIYSLTSPGNKFIVHADAGPENSIVFHLSSFEPTVN